VLELEVIACPLCGEGSATTLFEQRDFALGVPGRFSLVRCPRCGLLYQNPRIRMDQLDLAYPANYPPHTKDPEVSRVARRLGPGGPARARSDSATVISIRASSRWPRGCAASSPAGASSRRSCRGWARAACSTSAAPWGASWA
jgi:hypothetical protein